MNNFHAIFFLFLAAAIKNVVKWKANDGIENLVSTRNAVREEERLYRQIRRARHMQGTAFFCFIFNAVHFIRWARPSERAVKLNVHKLLIFCWIKSHLHKFIPTTRCRRMHGMPIVCLFCTHLMKRKKIIYSFILQIIMYTQLINAINSHCECHFERFWALSPTNHHYRHQNRRYHCTAHTSNSKTIVISHSAPIIVTIWKWNSTLYVFSMPFQLIRVESAPIVQPTHSVCCTHTQQATDMCQ